MITDLIAEVYDLKLRKYFKGKVLDLGCGKVPLYQLYKDYASEVICADWKNSLHKNKYLDKNIDINQNLDFDSCEFDTVLLSDVFEHIIYPNKLMIEIHRILKTDGNLIMNVPFFYYLHEEPYDYFRYTKFALQTLAEEAGLKVLELHAYGGVLEILVDLISKIVLVIPLIGKTISRCGQTFAWIILKTKLGIKISERTSAKFPLGYYMVVKKVN